MKWTIIYGDFATGTVLLTFLRNINHFPRNARRREKTGCGRPSRVSSSSSTTVKQSLGKFRRDNKWGKLAPRRIGREEGKAHQIYQSADCFSIPFQLQRQNIASILHPHSDTNNKYEKVVLRILLGEICYRY